MKLTEIELQVQVENIEPLKQLLAEQGVFKYEHHQLDQYFVPAHRDFLAATPIEEWLRLRDANGIYSLNYKKWHFDENQKGLYADEYETKIDSLVIGEKILAALNMRPIIRVDKVRQTWDYGDYEISLDAVAELGNFVELEYTGDLGVEDHQAITDGMVTFLKNLGCGEITMNRRGYPALLLDKRGK